MYIDGPPRVYLICTTLTLTLTLTLTRCAGDMQGRRAGAGCAKGESAGEGGWVVLVW